MITAGIDLASQAAHTAGCSIAWSDGRAMLLSMPQPLSVSADRIALPAMRAASLLSGLGTRVALDGSGVVVEVYPAAALRRWNLPSRGYKRKDGQGVRRELVSRFFATTDDWLTVGDTAVGLCAKSDDAFDAVIAAMVARAEAVGLTEPIPDDLSSAALREGWIAVPLPDSLHLLAATHGCIRHMA